MNKKFKFLLNVVSVLGIISFFVIMVIVIKTFGSCSTFWFIPLMVIQALGLLALYTKAKIKKISEKS